VLVPSARRISHTEDWTMMTTSEATPQAWVGCLACYNAGHLVGEWIDGAEAGDPAAWAAAGLNLGCVDTVHGPCCGRCGGDEWWIFDHEGYGGLIEECSPAEAQTIAEVLDDLREPAEAFAAFIDHYGRPVPTDWGELVEGFEEAYAGEWDSERDYAEEFADDVYGLRRMASRADGVSEIVARYFDYEAFARDLFMGDVYSAPEPGGGIYVFRRL
jgi:antirestriction protein